MICIDWLNGIWKTAFVTVIHSCAEIDSRSIAMRTLFESAFSNEIQSVDADALFMFQIFFVDDGFCRYLLRIAFNHREEPNEANVRDENE